MPVNELEKQVQQRMEELTFTPSAEVWTEVEKRIREKKKRRRILFGWLIPCLLLGGGLLYYNAGEKRGKTTAGQEQPTEKTLPAPQNGVPVPPAISGDNARHNPGQAVERKEENDSKKTNIAPATTISPRVKANTNVQNFVRQEQVDSKKPPYAVKKRSHPVTADEDKIKEPVTAVTPINESVKTDSTPETVTITPARDVTASSKDSMIAAVPAAIQDSSKTETVEDKKPVVAPATRKKRWNYGFGVQAGSSNTRSGGIFGGGMASYEASPLTNTSGGGTYTGPPVYIDAPRKGVSWGLHAFAQKDLSPGLSLRATLQYDYFSTRIRTGNRVDSSRQVNNSISDNLTIQSFYGPPAAGGPARSYTNRYHLAGVSVTVAWKLIRTGQFNLAWENSVGLSRLFSTNALHYDRNLRVYYRDFEPFRKTQFFFSSGFAFPVLNGEKLRISLHPFVQYAPGNLLKENNGPRSHFVNYGVGLKFLLPKRK